MNKKISSDEFHNSIDRQLSGLKPDPWLAQHIMASAKEEEPVKKFAVSTALIVVLIVIATPNHRFGCECFTWLDRFLQLWKFLKLRKKY